MMDIPEAQSLPEVLSRWQAGEIGYRHACAALDVEMEQLYALAREHGTLPTIPLREEAVADMNALLEGLKP